ncbi:uncharacterized protein LOC117649650 [Thrips palmi]|uniref:Uncharacterized protein LOC117649650 n=1 Tax=Thrips palmi TaxID=161013 RepID=A0A6P8ZTB5_THRPL|nr:uncharacterized protein LOC117649650 [Thrips palmi]
MPFSRPGATVTLLAVAATAVALATVSEAAPAAVGSFEGLIRNRPPLCKDAAFLRAFKRNNVRAPCFLSESDELPFVMVPLEPLGADLDRLDLMTSVDDAESEDVLTPSTPWGAAERSVPVYRGSSVGSKAWYRGVAARDEDADDNPLSFSLFHEEQEPVVVPAEEYFPRSVDLGVAKDRAEDFIKVSFLDDLAAEEPVEDVAKDLSRDVANELPAEETTENLVEKSSELVRGVPDKTFPFAAEQIENFAPPAAYLSFREIVKVLGDVKSPLRGVARLDHREEEVPDGSPTRMSWRVPAGHDLFPRDGASEDPAQRAAGDFDEDAVKDLDEDAAKDLTAENLI